MKNIEEYIRYLKLIRIEGLEKIGYVYAREAIDNVLKDRERLKQENEIQGDNYKGLIADVSSIAKKLGLEEDATIDEIYVAIRMLKSKRVNMFERLDCIEKKDKIIDAIIEKYEYNARINVKNFVKKN